VGGGLLTRAGLAWYNPDTFAREAAATLRCDQTQANALAWAEGVRRLDTAIAQGSAFAFETTLGGHTIAQRLHDAATTHDVLLWYCGLESVERHLARIQARVARGGHDIPEDKVRERWHTSRANLIGLMPVLTHLRVYDNSADAIGGRLVHEPMLVLEMAGTQLIHPGTVQETAATPDWAKPIVEAAFELMQR
jgi:predicted ABC-type ATPase